MSAYIAQRVGQTLIVLLGVLLLTFILVHLIPGDPALVILGTDATPEELDRLRSLLGLDQPLPVQFATYLRRVAQGDFGDSIFQNEPVMKLILERLPATIELTVTALIFAAILGGALGIFSALRPYSWFDAFASVLALAGVAMPVFWLGMLAILIFSLELGWFPSFGRGAGLIPSTIELFQTGDPERIVRFDQSPDFARHCVGCVFHGDYLAPHTIVHARSAESGLRADGTGQRAQ